MTARNKGFARPAATMLIGAAVVGPTSFAAPSPCTIGQPGLQTVDSPKNNPKFSRDAARSGHRRRHGEHVLRRQPGPDQADLLVDDEPVADRVLGHDARLDEVQEVVRAAGLRAGA